MARTALAVLMVVATQDESRTYKVWTHETPTNTGNLSPMLRLVLVTNGSIVGCDDDGMPIIETTDGLASLQKLDVVSLAVERKNPSNLQAMNEMLIEYREGFTAKDLDDLGLVMTEDHMDMKYVSVKVKSGRIDAALARKIAANKGVVLASVKFVPSN